ncbi:MAG: RluA family pseudouridine synthase [Planctomycetota bacterium]
MLAPCCPLLHPVCVIQADVLTNDGSSEAPKPEEDSASQRGFLVAEEHRGWRLDRVLAAALADHSRAYLRELIEAGEVRVDGQLRPGASRVEPGQRIEVVLVPRHLLRSGEEAQRAELCVLFEDDQILVIDKAAGMAAHPGGSALAGTVSQAAEARLGRQLPSLGDPARGGIVHRLDQGTTGVMVLAKTQEALARLHGQFKGHTVEKEYRALVYGEPRFESDYIERPIARDPRHPERMKIVTRGGRASLTYYEVVERFRGFAHLRCRPETGRTHQIRVHLSHAGHSLLGDRRYRARRNQGVELPAEAPLPGRQCLHASRLGFAHPGNGGRVSFEAPLPEDLLRMLAWLREERGVPGT